MHVRFLSLIDPAPPGFTSGHFGKRELLSGAVVLLTPSNEAACALLDGFESRVEGILLSIGETAMHQVGPLLWHLSLPQAQISSENESLALMLDILSAASSLRNRAVINERRANHLADELDTCRHDYTTMRNSLYNQVLRLTDSENRLSSILNSTDVHVYMYDRDGNFLFANQSSCTFLGIQQEQVVGTHVSQCFDAATVAHIRQSSLHTWENGEFSSADEIYTLLSSGKLYHFNTRRFPLRRDDGSVYAVCGISIDIAERKENEKRQRLAASVFASSYEGIVIADEQNRIVDVNPAFTRITGYLREEVIGQPALQLLYSGKGEKQLDESIRQHLEKTSFWRREVQNRRKEGEEFSEMLSVTAVRDTDGKLSNYIAVFSDISQLKKQESEIHRISYHDTLTGLPNRRLLLERMTMALTESRRNNKLLAVCCLDLDGFKTINERYGERRGDEILIAMANQIKKVMRVNDQIARLSGDEFSLIITGLDRVEDSYKALERVLQAVRKPIEVGEEQVTITGSLGAALFPIDNVDCETLMRHADQAMYQAKKSGGNVYQLFDAEHERQSQQHRDTVARLRIALQNNEFELYYQPKVNLSTGCVVGAEALIRWNHPENGILSPNAFLHFLEGSLSEAVGEWVIDSALTQMVLWHAAGLSLPVSVNIDGAHLSQTSFADRLADLLASHAALPPDIHLEMEILETAALADTKHAVNAIERCRQLGVRFSLDDFGTGYSSLTYLRSLPIDTLKIDQSFVRDMLEDKDDMGIVESIVRLGSAFSCSVIAEGTESMEHGAALLRLGCQMAQGYGIARPMPAMQMEAWVRQWHAQAPWKEIQGG